jgi:hypothetical protein
MKRTRPSNLRVNNQAKNKSHAADATNHIQPQFAISLPHPPKFGRL